MSRQSFKSLCGVLVTLTATTVSAQVAGGGGGSGSSNWQITMTYDGSDTYVYPVYDGTLHAYRLRTDVRDWSTNTWTLDGVSTPGLGGPSNASWNTPTAFSGYAESKGTAQIKVKWIGSGSAPTYTYLMLTSAAGAADQAENPGTYSADDGQGDPVVAATGSSTSSGIHPKRLKLDSGGEATYSVSMSAKASKTGTSANLVANTGASYNLDVKALSLFVVSYQRAIIRGPGGVPMPWPMPAWTGDIEHETAEEGAPVGGYIGGVLVNTIGSWYSTWTFTSGISKGSHSVNTDSYGHPSSIDVNIPYSLSQLVGMRTSPDTVTVTGHGTDPSSSLPGPFDSTLSLKIWAEERPITLNPNSSETETPTNLPGTSSPTVTVTGGTQTFYGPMLISESATTGISGRSGSISDVAKLGIESDGSQLPYWANAGASITVPSVPVPVGTWTFVKVVKRFYIDRTLAAYGTGGYSGDFNDTIQNSQSVEISTKLLPEGSEN